MAKVRCAVIGSGWWGTAAHVPALRDDPRADLVAIQHHDPDTAARVARDFDVPHACAAAEQVLDIDALDAVVISSTPHLHYPQARAALKRGLHVLVEKPMTITADQAQELVDLAARQDRQLIVGCTFHYTDHAAEARRLIRAGEIGDVKMIHILMTDESSSLYRGEPWERFVKEHHDEDYMSGTTIAPQQGSYNDPAVAGGGQIYAQVSHPAAYVSFLTGDRPQQVHAHFDNAGLPVDIYDILNIRMDQGTLVSIASCGSPMGGPRELPITVYGTGGTLKIGLADGTMTVYKPDQPPQSPPGLSDYDIYPRYAPAQNLIDVATGDAPNRSPGLLGLYSMQIIEAACQSARTGQNITI